MQGWGFDPWSGNEDPTCHAAWPKKKVQFRSDHSEEGREERRVDMEILSLHLASKAWRRSVRNSKTNITHQKNPLLEGNRSVSVRVTHLVVGWQTPWGQWLWHSDQFRAQPLGLSVKRAPCSRKSEQWMCMSSYVRVIFPEDLLKW